VQKGVGTALRGDKKRGKMTIILVGGKERTEESPESKNDGKGV